MHGAGFLVKSRALSDNMVAEMQARPGVSEQRAEALLAVDQWYRTQILMAGLFIALFATDGYDNPFFNMPHDALMFQILAGLYVIVDGIDNYARGVMRALPGVSWDRVFFFPKTLSD
jgi:hypothetical protein